MYEWSQRCVKQHCVCIVRGFCVRQVAAGTARYCLGISWCCMYAGLHLHFHSRFIAWYLRGYDVHVLHEYFISVLTILLMVYPISVFLFYGTFVPLSSFEKKITFSVVLFVKCRFKQVFDLHIIYLQKIKYYLHFYIYLHFTTQIMFAFHLAFFLPWSK